ncbi:hypothetical protein HK101_004071, partial [Irineochytrium annulatum]
MFPQALSAALVLWSAVSLVQWFIRRQKRPSRLAISPIRTKRISVAGPAERQADIGRFGAFGGKPPGGASMMPAVSRGAGAPAAWGGSGFGSGALRFGSSATPPMAHRAAAAAAEPGGDMMDDLLQWGGMSLNDRSQPRTREGDLGGDDSGGEDAGRDSSRARGNPFGMKGWSLASTMGGAGETTRERRRSNPFFPESPPVAVPPSETPWWRAQPKTAAPLRPPGYLGRMDANPDVLSGS